jgi:hypothetical protein
VYGANGRKEILPCKSLLHDAFTATFDRRGSIDSRSKGARDLRWLLLINVVSQEFSAGDEPVTVDAVHELTSKRNYGEEYR